MVSILNIFIDFKCIHDRFMAVLFKSMGGEEHTFSKDTIQCKKN